MSMFIREIQETDNTLEIHFIVKKIFFLVFLTNYILNVVAERFIE